jgi:hypothetical protein
MGLRDPLKLALSSTPVEGEPTAGRWQRESICRRVRLLKNITVARGGLVAMADRFPGNPLRESVAC